MTGRPRIDDNAVLMDMSENWVSNNLEVSFRELAKRFRSRLSIGPDDPLKAKDYLSRDENDHLEKRLDSAQKRVADKFSEWEKNGTALKIGVYREVRATIYRLRFNNSAESIEDATTQAIQYVSKKIGKSDTETSDLYEEGIALTRSFNRP